MARIKEERPSDVKPDAVGGALAEARPTGDPEVARALRMSALLGAVVGTPVEPVTVGGWVLERFVGAGGMGSVYRARDAGGRVVALKLLHREAESSRARFAREAALLQRILHPRVVRYVDHGVAEDGRTWLVMEWLEGEDLAALLRRGPLPLGDALSLAMGVALGLGAVHRAGVVHRDVKPANVFLVGGRLDDARVVDLGVALPEGEEARMTTTGAVMGTPHYMAPEQVNGRAGVRSDVYALGACLWECLAGVPPFGGDTPGAVLQAVLFDPPPSVAQRRPELPPAVDTLLGRMLAKDPSRRPADMEAVVLELAELLAGRGPAVVLSRAERPPGPVTEPVVAPGPLVGRAPELGQLRGLMAHAIEDGPVLAAILGPAGSGRSALVRAVAAEWTGDREVVRCEPADSGLPFALVRRLLAEGSPPTDGDPLVAADRLRLAWLHHVETRVSSPFALFLDDLHLADLPSLRLVALAWSHLGGGAPFALVFTAPPDAVPAFALTDPRLARVPLGPLGPRAMQQVAARWGVPPDLAELAAGNPGALYRLSRADSPAWAGFEALSSEERRVARACALAGPAPEREVVAALLGVGVGDAALEAGLLALARVGLLEGGALTSRGTVPGGPAEPPRFPSDAVREAVLATCTDEDRLRGAEAMAGWLEDRHRPAERARHLLVLGRREEAVRSLLLAARQGVAAGDEAWTARCLEEAGREAGPGQLGEVALLRAQVALWRGEVDAACEAARGAMTQLPAGSAPWFEAAGQAITALGQRGAHLDLAEVVAAVLARDSDGDARVVSLCRAVSQLAGSPSVEPLAAAALSRAARSVEARAWQARARAALASVQSFDASIAAQVEAHRAHVRAGDPRSAAQIGLYLGSWYVWSGAWERAEETLADSLRTARRLGASYLELWGRYVMGKLAVEIGDPVEARQALERVAAEAEGSPRIQAGARLWGALAAHRAGELALAATLAEAAEAHPGVRRAARAARCRAVLASGGEVGELPRGLGRPEGREVEWDELVFLARAEVGAGIPGELRPRVREAADRIRARAATLADPLRRNDYLGRPHLVARTLAWEAELGAG